MNFTRNRKVIVNVGRLDPEKGQLNLIRAFSEICNQYEDVCLVIIGEGDQHKALEDAINYYELADKVLLLGYTSNISSYLKASNIFILSSIIEGMPNVILEAMQNGLPVISTECGAREIIAPHTDAMYQTDSIDIVDYGILIPLCASSVDEVIKKESSLSCQELIMAEAITKLIDDNELRNRYIDRNKECLNAFSTKLIMEKWKTVIDG